MEFYDDISSVVEETNGMLCRNRKRNYDGDDDDNNDEDEGRFKSKNLKAERKRREKLKSRMLELRSLVPKITNLNKETIITDAIDYIEELQDSVTNLTNEIHKIEAELAIEQSFDILHICQEEKMKKWGIESEVEVSRINENKLWMKIVFEKKVGGFTKLIQAMSMLGIELVDTSVTTTKGAVLVTSCIEGKMLIPEQVREELVDVIKVL
ncbi:hypothetical protein LXL04_027159 [Taraxacum kok-saghyz]